MLIIISHYHIINVVDIYSGQNVGKPQQQAA